jgi:hypothetical protein
MSLAQPLLQLLCGESMSAALELRTTSPVFAYLQRRDATSPARGAFFMVLALRGIARRLRETNMAALPRIRARIRAATVAAILTGSGADRRDRRVASQ